MDFGARHAIDLYDAPAQHRYRQKLAARRIFRNKRKEVVALIGKYVFGDWSLAFNFGILTRFGLANLIGVEVSRLTTNFGVRTGLEAAWRFTGPMELVFEAGIDTHTSPAVLTRVNRPPPGVSCPTIESVLVEDLITAYGVLAVRLRP